MKHRQQSAVRRLSVITIDQAISGASNVLIAIFAARVLSVSEFGLFGIVFIVYVIALGVSRALVCDPLLVHTTDVQERPGAPIGTACLLALGVAATVAVAGAVTYVWQPALGSAVMVLAACLPLLLLQDLGRYLGFATQNAGKAVVLDVTWLVLVIATIPVLTATDARSLVWFITAWGGTGAVTGLLLFWQQRGHRPQLDLGWLRHTWMFSWRYLVSYTSTQSSSLVASGAVWGIAGTRALGAVQGTVLLTRPFMTFQIAAVASGVADISRMGSDAGLIRQRAARISALTGGVAIVNAVIMLVLPSGAGRMVLGHTWDAAQPLLLPTAVQLVFLGAMTGARAGLLGSRAVRRSMLNDVIGTVLFLVAITIGTFINGALGGLWAAAIAQATIATMWWVTFRAQGAPVPAAAMSAPTSGAVA